MLKSINIIEIASIAKLAGEAIMNVYRRDFTVEYKDDKSPLTEADRVANDIICSHLLGLYPHIPIISEENREIPYETRREYEYFWLVDPLDGTKEFIKKNGEFTVNIALIQSGEPVLGVVYAPAIDVLYFAKRGDGAFVIRNQTTSKMPQARSDGSFVIVGSKSHTSNDTEAFIDDIKTDKEKVFISMGSSLKLCLVAEGVADIYPRLAPTMEWDTAAADAIVRECDKKVIEHGTQRMLQYNKDDMHNPWFVVL